MIGNLVPLDTNNVIPSHKVERLFGWSFNVDTIWATVIAGLILIGLGFIVRAKLTKRTDDHVPTKLQLIWEGVVKEVNTQVEDNLGRVHPYVAPLAIAMFMFILIANWIEIIPTEPRETHWLPAPTSDANLTYALAILAMISVWVFGFRRHGLRGYLKNFIGQSIFPDKPGLDVVARTILTFLNVIEELVKPLTLALRLFGNIFAGSIMIALIALLPLFVPIAAGDIVWKLFDMFIGAIQAFIFALLTVIYFGMAATGHGGEEHDAAEHSDADGKTAQSDEVMASKENEPALVA